MKIIVRIVLVLWQTRSTVERDGNQLFHGRQVTEINGEREEFTYA